MNYFTSSTIQKVFGIFSIVFTIMATYILWLLFFAGAQDIGAIVFILFALFLVFLDIIAIVAWFILRGTRKLQTNLINQTVSTPIKFISIILILGFLSAVYVFVWMFFA